MLQGNQEVRHKDTGTVWFNPPLVRIRVKCKNRRENMTQTAKEKKTLSNLSDIMEHSHASHLLLDGSVGVDLAAKLGSVGCMIHLLKRGKWRSLAWFAWSMIPIHFLIFQDWNWKCCIFFLFFFFFFFTGSMLTCCCCLVFMQKKEEV